MGTTVPVELLKIPAMNIGRGVTSVFTIIVWGTVVVGKQASRDEIRT